MLTTSGQLATSEKSLQAQVMIVNEFARKNFLKLNLSKCGWWCSLGASRVHFQSAKWRVRFCQLVVRESALDSGGREIFWLPVQWKRTSRRHGERFSIMGVLASSRVI